MSDHPWIVFHLVDELTNKLGRQPTLAAAQALAEGAGPGVASATHARTGERWLRVNGKWHQTQKPDTVEPEPPARYRADIDGPAE